MVRIRLRGLPPDLEQATILLGELFDIASDGGNRALHRETTPEQFRYVHARPITEPMCVVCGCTQEAACEGGCAWLGTTLDVDLCTACAHIIASESDGPLR
jgi:hypothetical protein